MAIEGNGQLWRLGTFVVEPVRNGGLELKGRDGVVHATSGKDGTIADAGGAVLLRAPLRTSRASGRVAIDIEDADGRRLGEAAADSFTFGLGRRKMALSIRDRSGNERARLEPRDNRSEHLALVASGSDVATIRVESVKAGLLRKSRVYSVDVIAEVAEPVDQLALAAVVRYDALLRALEESTTD